MCLVSRRKPDAKSKVADVRRSRRPAEPVAKQGKTPPPSPAPGHGHEDPATDSREEGTRERMVEGAARLLAQRGLQATSFSEVLDATGAPRGSVYHHFPEGKNQLIKAALDFVDAQMAQLLDPKDGAPAPEITEFFLRVWRSVLTRSDFRAGCAVAAVTVAADTPELLEHTAAIFRSWRSRLAELLAKGGLSQGDAVRFAAMLIAASEGAVILSRGEKSLEPFDLVAAQLTEQVKRWMR
jgi:TetR/AcrR family transcriptional regulator, lmrAB and yxaGH operons repressor